MTSRSGIPFQESVIPKDEVLVGTVVQNGHLSTRRLRQGDSKFEASRGYLVE